MKSNDALLVGAKGGGSSSFRNRPDNLRSTDTFEAVLGLSSSYLTLAPGGLRNLFVNDIPVEDGQGNASFKEFAATLFQGDPTILQPVTLKLGQSSGQVPVNLSLNNPNTGGIPGDWRNAAVTTPNVNFIDIRFVVQQLFAQTKQGVNDQVASIEVQLRPSGASQWHNPLQSLAAPPFNQNGIPSGLPGTELYFPNEFWDTGGTTWRDPAPGLLQITGKTTSPYVKELRVAVPNQGAYANRTWEIRCRLIEPDTVINGENEDRRTITFESVAGVISEPLGGTEPWRGLAWLQIHGQATDQITGIPEITGIYDIGRHLVPPMSVWNPVTRTYTGAAWDGVTNINAWTQCPAWQIKSLIEDDLSGVSALSPGSTLNKWDVLEASKWFAQHVSDGRGGTHPRYSMNWFQEQPMQVKELVNYLAGAVGAFCWDEGDGTWRMKVERPENPIMIFTKQNIFGEFIYAHTDFDSRINDFTGVFRNEELRYKEDRVRVFDQQSIDDTGRRHTTIALVGCTNRQEALRRLKIRLLTSLNETRQVTFTTNRQGLLLEPLSVIAIADEDLNSDTTLRSTGRILQLNPSRTQITLRDSVRLEIGVAYNITVTIPNPNYNPETNNQPADLDWRKPTLTITRNIVNNNSQRGDVTTLFLDAALPASTPELAPFALGAPGLPALPKQYRVVNVSPAEDGETVVVQAVEIYTSKWLESDNVNEQQINSQVSNRTIRAPLAPPDGMFSIVEYQTEFELQRVLVVRWLRPPGMFLRDYRIEYSYNGGPWLSGGTTRETYYELVKPQQGVYRFRIYARDRRDLISQPLEGEYVVTEILSLLGLISIADDNVVTVREKVDVRAVRDRIVNEFPIWRDQAFAFNVTASVRTEYQQSYDQLMVYLASIGIDVDADSAINRDQFIGFFNNYALARERILEAITQESARRAIWGFVTGPGRPEDNADVTANKTAAFVQGQGPWTTFDGATPAQLIADVQTANADAQIALIAVSNIASDGKFTPNEKFQVRRLRNDIVIEFPVWLARAAQLEVPIGLRNNYQTAYDSLIAYLATVQLDVDVTTNVSRAALNQFFASYFTAREQMMDAITVAASQRATWSNVTGAGRPEDNADVTANKTAAFVAGQGPWATYLDVSPAQLTADAAQAKADSQTSLASLANIAADNVLTRGEKHPVRQLRDAIFAEFPVWRDRGINIAAPVATRNAYQAAYDALFAYLASIAIDSDTNSSINRSQFNSAFTTYFSSREQLIDAITLLASQRAQWSGVTGTGRPEDNADVTANRTAAFVAGQGPWATTSVPVQKLTAQRPNWFPYPFMVTDGRSATQLGWANAGAGNGFQPMQGVNHPAVEGAAYVYSRGNGGPAATVFPFYDVPWADFVQCSMSMTGYAGGTGTSFGPYIEFLNAAKTVALGQHTASLNPLTDRWEVNGANPPPGTAWVRVVIMGVFQAAGAGVYQDIVFWGVKVERGPHATPLSESSTTILPAGNVEYNNGAHLNLLRPQEFGANVTENRTAAFLAGQGALATQNQARASQLLLGAMDNIIPDGFYQDRTFWGIDGWPNIGFNEMDFFWEQRRALGFTCDRDFDIYSQFFPVEVGATYRVRCRVWNNSTSQGWSGAFWPMIHIPFQAWFSLHNGQSVDPGTANAANAIVANGDTFNQDWFFRINNNAADRIQFRFRSTARGSGVLLQVQISKVPTLGRDLIIPGTAQPYPTGAIETALGTAAFINGQTPWATFGASTGRVNFLNDAGRATSRRGQSQIVASGVLQTFTNNPITAVTDQNTAIATIIINDHNVLDDAGLIWFAGGSIGNLSANTLYHVWEFNPDFVGGARTYHATTNRNDLTIFGRRYVGFVTTPPVGSGPVGGGGGGGGNVPGDPNVSIP